MKTLLHKLPLKCLKKQILRTFPNKVYLSYISAPIDGNPAINVYDFTPAETIAIGDGFNDLSMIRYAALGVAMENAPDGVKESADYITARTNNEDGVAEVLEKFVL